MITSPADNTSSSPKPTQPAKTTTTAKKAEPAKTTTTVKKTEPAKTTATTAKKAEPTKSFADRKKSTTASAAAATSLVSDNERKPARTTTKPAQKTTASKPASKEKTSDGNKKKKIMIIAIASSCVFVVLLSVILGVTLSANRNPVKSIDRYDLSYSTNTVVRYGEQTLGNVSRNKPVKEVKDERSAFDAPLFAGHEDNRYPTYGSTLGYVIGMDDAQVAARNALISESSYLCAWGTAGANNGGPQTEDKYTKIDKNGWLYQYKNGEWIHSLTWGKTDYVESNYRRLYKHAASKGLYLGDVSDSEPAIVKELTFSSRDYECGYGVTGLYAPAGEVIKVEMSGADMNATNGITIHIGQALFNGQANNIWMEKNQMQRFPYLLNTLNINKQTAEYNEKTDTWTGYIGSFIGGPIYIRNKGTTNNPITFNTTISGGVAYSHFILGYTTKEEFEKNSKSSAPYFDLEVWDNGVLHSGPKRYAQEFSYDDLYKAAVLWDKVSSVTASNNSKYGIVFIYDPFVAAGAAVAFPGRNSVNCPTDWMSSSLNYEATVTSGSWGNFHEYHHNFQNYGVGYTGEVTNNGLNLVSYSLFTNISALRQLGNYGGAGLSDWNQYTSATWALNQVNNEAIESTNGLAVYATLLHNFGQDVYINARGNWGANYLNRYAALTHQDFSYFDSKIAKYSEGPLNLTATDYPLFVPVSSVYQTGRTYNYDGKKIEINTMRPYVIPYGEPYTVDLNPYTASSGQYVSGSVVIGNGFTYKIKSVNTKGVKGKFVETSKKGIYTFTPNTKYMQSGKIYVTLEITTTDGAKQWNGHALEDVDLILEFQQSHETKKAILERTTYTYAADKMYTDAATAFESNFANYSSVEKKDHSNPTQNANTDIWFFYPDTQENREKYPNASDTSFARNNSIEVIDGKLYIRESGKYRVYLRGRFNCALYYSIGGSAYKLGASIKNGSGDNFYYSDPNTYFDVEFRADGKVLVNNQVVKENYKGDRWIYIKEVLIVQTSPRISYIGVGIAQWTPLYSATTDDKGVTHYWDRNGNEVDPKDATDTTPKAPTTNRPYATAYRQSYEFQKQFESDYFYTRSYTYSYSNVAKPSANAAILETKNVNAYGDSPVQNILTESGLSGTTGKFQVSANKFPMEISVDLGKEITANRIDLYGTLYNGNSYHPKKYYILVGNSSDNISTPFGPQWDNVQSTTGNTGFSIDKPLTFRYYKIVVEAWSYGQVQFRHIKFSYTIPGTATLYSLDNAMFTYKGKWYGAQANSNFGHVYVGKKGASVTFEFEGSRLGILSSVAYGADFEVKIDKKKVSSEYIMKEDADTYLSYLSGKLSSGKHKVTIKCKGTANIDSIVVYP